MVAALAVPLAGPQTVVAQAAQETQDTPDTRGPREPWEGPRATTTLGLGFAGFGGDVAPVMGLGGTLDVRFGVEVLPWLALEARYLGGVLATRGGGPGPGSVALNGGALVAEVSLPAGSWVWPYAFAGAGGYLFTPMGGGEPGQREESARAQLRNATLFAMPLGLGFSVQLPMRLRLLFEGSYHALFGQALSDDPERAGGGLWMTSVLLRAAF
jgi:opacity protein-like surface antigen